MKRTTRIFTRLWPKGGAIFTLIIAGLLLAGAIVSGSMINPLTPTWQERLGFAPRDLFTFNWIRMLTSALVTSGGKIFWLAFALMIALVLTAEKLTGTYRTMLSFWFPHLGALVGGSLLTWLAVQLSTGWSLSAGWSSSASTALNEIYALRDVGPSAGYFGCLGLIVAQIRPPWKYLIGLGTVAGLIGGMVFSAHTGAYLDVTAGLAHLVAFPLGWSIAYAPFLKRVRA